MAEKKEQEDTQMAPSQMIGVEPVAWNKIVAYISEIPINFANAEKAVEVKQIISKAMLVNLGTVTDQVKEK